MMEPVQSRPSSSNRSESSPSGHRPQGFSAGCSATAWAYFANAEARSAAVWWPGVLWSDGARAPPEGCVSPGWSACAWGRQADVRSNSCGAARPSRGSCSPSASAALRRAGAWTRSGRAAGSGSASAAAWASLEVGSWVSSRQGECWVGRWSGRPWATSCCWHVRELPWPHASRECHLNGSGDSFRRRSKGGGETKTYESVQTRRHRKCRATLLASHGWSTLAGGNACDRQGGTRPAHQGEQ
jgi:hypothetical protein